MGTWSVVQLFIKFILSLNLRNLLLFKYVCKLSTGRIFFQMTSKTKKADMNLIAGCFYGLCRLLVNFTQSAEEGK